MALLPQQFALPFHQTDLVLVPIPRQRAECGPAGNQGRVDAQLSGAPVTPLAQGIIPALFGGTRPVSGRAVPLRPLRHGQLQGALDRRLDTVPAACDAGYYPNGQSTEADPTINVVSHEHRESINDPLGNAWYDRRGYEGSDKCAWNFGTLTGDYNQTINGHHYALQQEWSNASSGCALHS